ncbi:hypothetical protein LINPERHAP2_LOCUS16059 [Linum perenne]
MIEKVAKMSSGAFNTHPSVFSIKGWKHHTIFRLHIQFPINPNFGYFSQKNKMSSK